jgi:hypothetical protein
MQTSQKEKSHLNFFFLNDSVMGMPKFYPMSGSKSMDIKLCTHYDDFYQEKWILHTVEPVAANPSRGPHTICCYILLLKQQPTQLKILSSGRKI